MKKLVLFISLFLASYSSIGQPSELMIKLRADIVSSPGNIVLRWDAMPDTGRINIYRKSKHIQSWGNPVATLPASATSYTDNQVIPDSAYEYQVLKNTIAQILPINPSGYIYASVQRAPQHNRGTFLLLVDSVFSISCDAEIKRLMSDINADGWKIIRKDFNRQVKDTVIKNYIVSEYNKDNTLNTVLILGHIAIPYSGNVWPDSHPDHKGAWPADVYYADVNGPWTDNTVNDTFSTRPENDNFPGDGKWDQSEIPTTVELAIGRVDFYDMPIFAKTEVTMMKSYLDKNHDYKTAAIPVVHRGLIDENFNAIHPLYAQETFADNGWKNFSVMLGIDSVKNLDLVSTLNNQNYQWAYGSGPGSYISSGGLGSKASFANNDVNSIFVLLWGSYYGNWDTKNNFLRAPLCADVPALATCWAGRPKWHLHHMAMGEPIGFSTIVTQNNKYITPGKAISYNPAGFSSGQIHVALMGDPALRLDYLQPPSSLTANRMKNISTLSWTPSADPNVIGYYIYSSPDSFGKYTLESTLVSSTVFSDTGNNSLYYMVRAAKKERNPSGSYINLSLGDRAMVNIVPDTGTNTGNVTKTINFAEVFPNPTNGLIRISINTGISNTISTITITSHSGVAIEKLTIRETQKQLDISHLPPGIYHLHIANSYGSEQFKILRL